eukprot:c199_g1_i1.p1 GENE.c199_g1_i1~~c199_g1_i1.p1  ORF type:complete len:426 (+),score=103.71 c199_g1_i1:71-1279(+)
MLLTRCGRRALAQIPSKSLVVVRAASSTSGQGNAKPIQKLLFTPGPLLTTQTVKESMLVDLGSRDAAFVSTIASLRTRLLALADLNPLKYTVVFMQGSGTFGVESVVGSVVPKTGGELLVIVNGVYGQRWVRLGRTLQIPTHEIEFGNFEIPSVEKVREVLSKHPSISHVLMCHCETTTGIINDVNAIGKLVGSFGKTFIVDSMSGFGAVPVDMVDSNIQFLVTSSNKCLEGVPGFSIVIANIDALKKAKGNARSLSLDLYDQWEVLEKTSQFRFTPPTHTFLALSQALTELEREGGIAARNARYQNNRLVIKTGFEKLGFQEVGGIDSYIITSYRSPSHRNWDFDAFCRRLSDHNIVIYPGKLASVDCFRVGNIGALQPRDCAALIEAVGHVLKEMNIVLK